MTLNRHVDTVNTTARCYQVAKTVRVRRGTRLHTSIYRSFACASLAPFTSVAAHSKHRIEMIVFPAHQNTLSRTDLRSCCRELQNSAHISILSQTHRVERKTGKTSLGVQPHCGSLNVVNETSRTECQARVLKGSEFTVLLTTDCGRDVHSSTSY